jgi:hypothetical protein
MKPFDLQEALNGAPVKLRNGRKAFVMYDLRKYPSLLESTGFKPLNGIVLGDDENDGDRVEWGELGANERLQFDIVGMWGPELTPEQVLKKAYEDDLLVLCDGNPDLQLKVIAKTKNGEFVVQPDDTAIQPWLANLTMEWVFVKDPVPKSDTITVTLPKPFKAKKGDNFWFITEDLDSNQQLKIDVVLDSNGDSINYKDGNCFRTFEDAQAWLDAMKNALDD